MDAGEAIIDTVDFSLMFETNEDDWCEEKIATLAEIICRAGDEPETKSAALLVLMATLENSTHPKALANTAKHFAFTRCGELNFYGMVDAQIAAIESELLDKLLPCSSQTAVRISARITRIAEVLCRTGRLQYRIRQIRLVFRLAAKRDLRNPR